MRSARPGRSLAHGALRDRLRGAARGRRRGMKAAQWRFARRQLTWMRRMAGRDADRPQRARRRRRRRRDRRRPRRAPRRSAVPEDRHVLGHRARVRDREVGIEVAVEIGGDESPRPDVGRLGAGGRLDEVAGAGVAQDGDVVGARVARPRGRGRRRGRSRPPPARTGVMPTSSGLDAGLGEGAAAVLRRMVTPARWPDWRPRGRSRARRRCRRRRSRPGPRPTGSGLDVGSVKLPMPLFAQDRDVVGVRVRDREVADRRPRRGPRP